MADEPARIGVLLSGRGSNFVAIHRAIEAGTVPARIVLVASNVEDAPGLATARELGYRAWALDHRGMERLEHEERLLAALRDAGVEWVCLAGYLRILSAAFVDRFPQRVLNVHPSLLPSFPGLSAQRQALDHGVRVTGCTVHLVDAGLDSGPIVCQRVVEVRDDDTESTLSARILDEEHRAFPDALARLLEGGWRVDGRRLVYTS